MVYIDADGCPVTKIAVEICRKMNVDVRLVFDTAHVFDIKYAEKIMVDKGTDSADMKIASLANKDDIVITQDYGVAAMCLAKGCICLSQDGNVYNEKNIDSLLMSRYIAKKIRNSGGRIKGQHKRTKKQNEDFQKAFIKILNERGFTI